MPLHHKKPVFYHDVSSSSSSSSAWSIIGKYATYLILTIAGGRLLLSLLTGSGPFGLLSSSCDDLDSSCYMYKQAGACESRPEWMLVNCAKSCNSCNYQDPYKRCTRKMLKISEKPVFGPGDLNKRLAGLKLRLSDKHVVNVLSSAPYVITIDHFLTDEEVESILASLSGWQEPQLRGAESNEGENLEEHQARAPMLTWCAGDCLESDGIKSVNTKIEEYLSIPADNIQPYPLMKFDKGQELYEHIDADESESILPCGPRILTLALCLLEPAAGGETEFPELKLKIEPKKGRALLFENVDDRDPKFATVDYRSINRDLPVSAGSKIIFKTFLHPYNFATSQKWNCVSHHSEMLHELISDMKRCCFYITGHGYGHFTRSSKLIRDLVDLNYHVTIVSIINIDFVKQNLEPLLSEGKVLYERRKLDAGAIQIGPLDLDLKATLDSYYSEIHMNHESLVRQEAEFLLTNNIQLVLTDVTPLVCAAAREANITSVIMSNLTWNYIYEDMLRSISDTLSEAEVSKYKEMIHQCDLDYASCTYHFRLPGPTPIIPNLDSTKVVPCPLVSRPSSSTTDDVLNQLNLKSSNAHILILSFGGHDFNSFHIKEEYLPDGWVCLLLGFRKADYYPEGQPSKLSSRFIFCPVDSYVPDLVLIADAFLGKIGYGTVSECLSSVPVTPLIYIPRDGWPEEPYLVNILDDNQCGISMPRDQFYSGNWTPYLQQALQRKSSAKAYLPAADGLAHADSAHLQLVGSEAGKWIVTKLNEL